MKILHITCMIISFALTAALAMAGEQRSLEELGGDLFNNPGLGGSPNELSCNSCHSRGHRLKYASTNPNLMQAIRHCLINRLNGSNGSRQVDMRALAVYVMEISGEISQHPQNPSPDMKYGFRPGGRESRPGLNRTKQDSRGQRPNAPQGDTSS
jgi:cytochrome c peroxidase